MPLFGRISTLALLLFVLVAGSAHAASVKQLPGKAGCFELGGAAGCAKGNGTEYVSAAAVSPDGRNVYAASGIGEFGALLVFSRDAKTGALTQLPGEQGCISSDGRGQQDDSSPVTCGVAPGLPQANDVAVSPDGLTVYTLAQAGFDDGQAVDVWRRDPATGTVTQLQCLTANADQPGCTQQPLNLPTKFVLTADGKQLVAAGSAITTFPVQDDGRLGAGTCRYKLEANPGNLCQSAPRLSGVREIYRIAASPDSKRLYAAGAPPYEDAAFGQLSVLDLAADGEVTLRKCAGDATTGRKCKQARGIDDPQDIAVSPDGRGVYTAASLFVITDEEDSTGHYASSGVAVFNRLLGQLSGSRGCLFYRGARKTAGCAKSPKARRPGFLGASAVGVTPNGRYALAGFSGSAAVALLKRNAKTQALKPVRGKGGCVSDRTKVVEGGAIKSCAKGHGIVNPQQVAFSPDSRNAYVPTPGGLSVYSVR
jgi:DNA-binding beta-propeller fold protein YncE